MTLLTVNDGLPVAMENTQARSDVLLICEHASRILPKGLGTLGLSEAALESHIAWDRGALGVSVHLSDLLDATLVHQRFSRLAYDCNRPPEAVDAMPAKSEVFTVPGNEDIDAAQKEQRIREIYQPFRDAVHALIAARLAAGRRPALVTIHSFTPVYHGQSRSVELGILHDEDARLADAMLQVCGQEPPFAVCRNAPYGPQDGVTHTLKEHGLKNGLFNVMIEIRNDLIRTEDDQKVMAVYLAGVLSESLASLT